MFDTGHQSGAGDAPTSRDGRVTGLTELAHSHGLVAQSVKELMHDPHRGATLEKLNHAQRRPLQCGVIVCSLPYVNWYKVQLDGTSGTIGCSFGGNTGFAPVGPRSCNLLPPNTAVIAWVPPGSDTGVILCSLPQKQVDGRYANSDYVVQGGQSGLQREEAYLSPFKLLYRQGGVRDFSAGRPADGTTLDWGATTETGLAVHLDPYLLSMRVDETCGLWLHYWDSHMRLAGWNMDWQTAAHEVVVRSDEGENRYAELHNVYPWETLGLYAPGQSAGEAVDAQKVQYDTAKGAIDLADADVDLQPIARYQEFGGYLGQGRLRLVSVPAETTGRRKYHDDPKQKPDMGVWMETIGLDGAYGLTSAKQIIIAKRSLIPVPKEIRLPEDQKTGDDARNDNYKFSGKFGNGQDHKIGDVKVEGDNRALTTAAGIDDFMAHAFNWRPLHPFHYHMEDYSVPEQSDLKNKSGAPQRLQGKIDFGELKNKMYLSDPSATKVKVDDRHGPVDYYERTSFFAQLPDGSVVIGDGSGCQITMANGVMRLDAPGGIVVTPGGSFSVLAGDDINLHARNSADLTAGKHDVRIKGEKNVQVLANAGGVLVESKQPFVADYANKLGEDVVSGGIVLKSAQGSVVTWGQEVYVRSTGGPITLDADKGNASVVVQAQAASFFVDSQLEVFIGPKGTSDAVDVVHAFGRSGALIGGSLEVDGGAAIAGNILGGGGMLNQSGYAAVAGSKFVGIGGDTSGTLQQMRQAITLEKNSGRDFHRGTFGQDLYLAQRPGNDKVIEQAAFSFRDDDDGTQYNTGDFALAESRWQMMVRTGLGTGGQNWDDEPKVTYQGHKQLPWPGRKKWEDDDTLLQVSAFTMFDAKEGRDKDRSSGPYAEPSLSSSSSVPAAQGFKVISD